MLLSYRGSSERNLGVGMYYVEAYEMAILKQKIVLYQWFYIVQPNKNMFWLIEIQIIAFFFLWIQLTYEAGLGPLQSGTRWQVYVNRKFIARLKCKENSPREIAQTKYLKGNHFPCAPLWSLRWLITCNGIWLNTQNSGASLFSRNFEEILAEDLGLDLIHLPVCNSQGWKIVNKPTNTWPPPPAKTL